MVADETGGWDVWIVGFEVPGPQAVEAIAHVFMVDAERAAALVALVPRGVRRGLDRQSAEETATALTAIGAKVEILPAGEAPALVASLRPPARPRAASMAGPRVKLKRAPRPVFEDDEPAYGAGSSAYVPRVSAGERPEAAAAPAPEPASDADDLDLLDVKAPSAEDPEDDADRVSDGFFEDELELGSLIPTSADAAVVASEALQRELARLPKVKVIPQRAPAPLDGVPDTPRRRPQSQGERTQQPEHAGRRPEPEPAEPRDPRKLVLLGGGVVVLLLGALLLRGALRSDESQPEGATPAVPSAGPASDAPTDRSLLAECDGLVLVEARTWLHLGEDRQMGSMAGQEARSFVQRLAAAGGVTAQVAIPSDSSARANFLLLQHTPFHAEALMAAATGPADGPVVAPECVSMSERYMLVRFDGCL